MSPLAEAGCDGGCSREGAGLKGGSSLGSPKAGAEFEIGFAYAPGSAATCSLPVPLQQMIHAERMHRRRPNTPAHMMTPRIAGEKTSCFFPSSSPVTVFEGGFDMGANVEKCDV